MSTDPSYKIAGPGRDIAVYISLLVLAAIQFFFAYQNISGGQMFARMLVVAVVEAGVALLFFMHLSDNRGLKWFVLVFTIAVIFGLQYGWTDSYRLLDGVPWAR